MRDENARSHHIVEPVLSPVPSSAPPDPAVDGQRIYQAITRKKSLVVVLLLMGTAVGFFLNLIAGSSDVGLWEAVVVLTGGSVDPTTDTVIRSIRLPMAAMAVLAGAAFAVGGCEMQTILGNPMGTEETGRLQSMGLQRVGHD